MFSPSGTIQLKRIKNVFSVWINPTKTEKEVEVRMCFTVELSRELNKKLLVAMRLGETPVPIPNTTVKT